MMYSSFFRCGCRPEICQWDCCGGHSSTAPSRLCHVLFTAKEALVQRRDEPTSNSVFQWFFCKSQEAVFVELLILNLQGQRTDAAEESKPPEKPKSTVNSEASGVPSSDEPISDIEQELCVKRQSTCCMMKATLGTRYPFL
eukprot:g19493.t1